MAESNFQPLSDVKVFIGDEVTVGTPTLTLGDWREYQVLDYSFNFPSAALEAAPTRAGRVTQADNQVKRRPENELYTASITMRGTATSVLLTCGTFFQDAVSPATLAGDYAPPHSKWQDAATTGITTRTLLFQNAGSDATNNDIVMTSCIPTRMKIMEDVASNNGMLILEVDYASGYKPSETALTATSPTVDTAAPKYIQNLTTMTLDSQPLVLWSWDLELTRTIQRVSYKDATDYKPYGMVQVGDLEVKANLSCKNDDSINDLAASFYNSTAVALSIAEASNFTISLPKCLVDKTSIEKGDGIQMANIPITAVHDATSEATAFVSITMA